MKMAVTLEPKVKLAPAAAAIALLALIGHHQLVGPTEARSMSVNEDLGQNLLQHQQPQQQLQFAEDAEPMALRRQLPDLIAQARTDRNMERALLKMLINAANLSRQSAPNSWQLLDQQALDAGGAQVDGPRMSARLEQVLDSMTASYPRDQYETVVDKREYNKPCLFNAVSCPKYPFRKAGF